MDEGVLEDILSVAGGPSDKVQFLLKNKESRPGQDAKFVTLLHGPAPQPLDAVSCWSAPFTWIVAPTHSRVDGEL